jgi:hypothetical protein
MRVHDWLVAVAAFAVTGATAACGPRESALAPLRCVNYPAFDTVVAVPPNGEMIRLPWPGNFVRFPNGAISDTASYRVTASSDSTIGFDLEPVDGAPSQFAAPVYIRLNYSPCSPRAPNVPRKLIWNAGNGWDTIPGSGSTGQPREVFGNIDHLTAFAIAN